MAVAVVVCLARETWRCVILVYQFQRRRRVSDGMRKQGHNAGVTREISAYRQVGSCKLRMKRKQRTCADGVAE